MCFLYFVIATIDYTTFRLVKTHLLLHNQNLFRIFVRVIMEEYANDMMLMKVVAVMGI